MGKTGAVAVASLGPCSDPSKSIVHPPSQDEGCRKLVLKGATLAADAVEAFSVVRGAGFAPGVWSSGRSRL